MKANFVLHPKYKDLESGLRHALDDFDLNEDHVSRGDRNEIKKAQIEGVVLNIKKFKTPNFFQGLVYRFLRKSKARRSFDFASKLIDLGIKTPFPIAYYERFTLGLKESYYICLHLEYDFDFRVLNHNPKFSNRPEILRQMARFTFNLHEQEINFLDHSPGNTLILESKEGSYEFYLIDLNRMSFESMNFEQRMRNFRRLWLSKTMINIMAEEYADLSNNSFERTHHIMTKYSRAFQKKVNSKKLRRKRKAAR